MKNLLRYTLAIFLGLALGAAIAYAVDGDLANDDFPVGNASQSSNVYVCDTYYLIENYDNDSGGGVGAEFDIMAHGGYPDMMVIEIDQTTGCTTTPSIDVNQGPTAGGTEHDLTNLSATLGTRATIEVARIFPDPFWNFDVTDDAGCTGLDLTYKRCVRK